MITVFSEDHRLHFGKYELIDGHFVTPFECPSRLDRIMDRIEKSKLGKVVPPRDFGLNPIRRVHSQDYIAFMRTAHDKWRAAHGDTDALPLCWPTRNLRQIEPEEIDGKLSYYSFDSCTPITSGTWRAITSAVNVALTGGELIQDEQSAVFALCRPPGHHAAADTYGGYCFFNNAAIVTQALLDAGAKRVAILDVDYHHGNGTQAIFYHRADVLFVSLHADPAQDFPFFLGRADETGENKGEGFNRNFPMRWGTGWPTYSESLERGLHHIGSFSPDVLVISLGVDTFDGDPISRFRLKSDHFLRLGTKIAKLSLPTLFIMEGGYTVDDIGVNVVNVLTGFENT